MKKTSFMMAAALVATMASCSKSGAPKADLQNDVDSLSYSIGLAQTQGLKPYLANAMGIDTTDMAEFIKGLNEGANAGDDKKKMAYFAGIQIGQQISQQMMKGINYELFGEDSTQTISLKNFMAGFISGVNGKSDIMTIEQAQEIATKKMESIKNEQIEKKYGAYKKENEKYMANIAKKAGVKALANGVYYEVIKEGKGAIPADTSRVKVNYVGKLIDGTVFEQTDSIPATFPCNAVIPGWTEALTHMPVGSKWIVYIPQDQAYGARETQKIKPYSALTFTIELLDIVTEK